MSDSYNTIDRDDSVKIERNTAETYKILSYWHNFKFRLIGEGIVIGICASFIVILYRYAIEEIGLFRDHILHTIKQNPLYSMLWFLVLLILSFFIGYVLKKEPMSSGSGIPQVQGELTGAVEMNWKKIILYKFTAGVAAIGAGLSLGREGPSIQLGAAMGKGVSKIFKRGKVEERYLITCGASAGLAAAFNAPLAGVIFALEELHKNFSPLVLLSAMSSALTADFISKHFFGLKPVFHFTEISPIPLSDYWRLIILGILVGASGVLFNYSLMKTLQLYASIKKIPPLSKPLLAFMSAGLLAFLLPEILGGGHNLIDRCAEGDFTITFLMILIVGKFIFTMISYGSGAPGGIFLPMLVIGALIGNLFGVLSVDFLGMSHPYIKNFIILAMAGYFTAVVRSPITASILITEMTGSFDHLLPLAIVSIIAYITADLLNSEPIYDSLFHRMLHNRFSHKSNDKTKVFTEISVHPGTHLDGKENKDIIWPENTLLVGIRRAGTEIIPTGTTVLQAGDHLVVLLHEDEHHERKNTLTTLSTKYVEQI